MKAISVAIHLWAQRKMRDIKFLHSVRLTNLHFEDILKYTGPGSSWNLLKNRTVGQLRCLWRNTLCGKHYFRGHNKTGFENESHLHEAAEQYCPFAHCQSGVMSKMDVDLIVLTPRRKPIVEKYQNPILSRNLFGAVAQEDAAQKNISESSILHSSQGGLEINTAQSDDHVRCSSSKDNSKIDDSELLCASKNQKDDEVKDIERYQEPCESKKDDQKNLIDTIVQKSIENDEGKKEKVKQTNLKK